MKKLIKQFFELENMSCRATESGELYEYSTVKKENYWLVIYDELEITSENQAKWLNECKSAITDPALDKNINLLFVWQADHANALFRKKVNHIEEDNYFFKKHVLLYTTAELEAIKQQVVKQDFMTVFHKLISTPKIFQEYKSNHVSGGWQSLLYRLAIKLPFILVDSSSKSDLASLEKNIENKIQNSKDFSVLLALDLAIDSLSDQITSQDLLPEEFLASITKKLPGEDFESNY